MPTFLDSKRTRLALVLFGIASLFACSVPSCAARQTAIIGQPPTPFAWSDEQAALTELRERARRIQTVQAACQLVLTRQGRTVRLDGALAARFPDQIRVRAWKMGSAVLDAAVHDDTAYVYDAGGDSDAGIMVARALADASELLGPTFIERAQWEHASSVLQLRGTLRDGRGVTCEVDRETLALRRFTIDDAVELRLRDHRVIDGMLWPTTIDLNSSQGSVHIRCTDLALNVQLPPAALAPSARARLVR
ncbi:MAG: hypothetical protein ACK46I_07370 [Phycisphaerae bacterium]